MVASTERAWMRQPMARRYVSSIKGSSARGVITKGNKVRYEAITSNLKDRIPLRASRRQAAINAPSMESGRMMVAEDELANTAMRITQLAKTNALAQSTGTANPRRAAL